MTSSTFRTLPAALLIALAAACSDDGGTPPRATDGGGGVARDDGGGRKDAGRAGNGGGTGRGGDGGTSGRAGNGGSAGRDGSAGNGGSAGRAGADGGSAGRGGNSGSAGNGGSSEGGGAGGSAGRDGSAGNGGSAGRAGADGGSAGGDGDASGIADTGPRDAGLGEGAVPDAGPTGMRVGTNFWNLGWGIWDDVFRPNVDFATTQDPWNPAFIREIRPYAALRFMDFGQINGSAERTWADRTPQTAPGSAQERLAYEWMIDLCNRVDRDMWISVPHLADDDYAYQLAQLLRRDLHPNLKIYVEWSNETWNGGFSQTAYAKERGEALHLDADGWTAAFKYHVYAAVRVFKQFDRVFGEGDPRVVKVLAGQSGNAWMTELHADALKSSTINPDGVRATAYAVAPYFGHEVDGAGGSAVADLRAAMKQTLDEIPAQARAARAAGLRFLAYEGGQHVLTERSTVVNRRAEMYAVYRDYLNGAAPHFDLFMHYLHNGRWGSSGSWGAEEYVGQPLSEAHKLRAIYDFIGQRP